MGINVTLAPMEEVPFDNPNDAIENGSDQVPKSIYPLEKENSSTCSNIAKKQPLSESLDTNPALLNNEELNNLRQCRNRAYSQVNKKKRLHLNASMSQHLQKEWLHLYPHSSLTGKKLLDIYETYSISAVVAGEPLKKSNRGRKRKVPVEAIVEKPQIKKSKSSPQSEFEANNLMEVVSEATHEDRQWTDAMLSNLMYCNLRGQINKTDLETEWQVLYPNSMLTARNLKSRLTVYQRTHSEKAAPKKPTREKIEQSVVKIIKSNIEPVKKPCLKQPKVVVNVEKFKIPMQSNSAVSRNEVDGSTDVTWTEAMVKDMFETLDVAREELSSTDTDIVNKRWHQLWTEKHPAFINIDSNTLYNQYLTHVKKVSVLSSPIKMPQIKIENNAIKDSESAIDSDNDAVNYYSDVTQSDKFRWNNDLIEELKREQVYVEDKLRCIQDDYFFELLQERWNNSHPDCKDSPEALKSILQTSINKVKSEPALVRKENDDSEQEFSNYVALESGDTKDNSVNTEMAPPKEEGEYTCKEEPVETFELPRSKWVCRHHYIHVFYDDQDKSYECILTDQLLQMRNALIPKFPAQDLFKCGKKPPGFAKMLLSEWLRHYPGNKGQDFEQCFNCTGTGGQISLLL